MGEGTLPACYGPAVALAASLCGLLWCSRRSAGLQRLYRRCIRGGNHRRYRQALAGHGAGGAFVEIDFGDRPPPLIICYPADRPK